MKKIILFKIPMSICNFRCSYCYLAQRPISYQGIQPQMRYTPEQVGEALSIDRMHGACFMNFCADGETLLTKDIDKYVHELVRRGHYAEVVTNLTVTEVLNKFLAWDKELLSRLEFKCSFHYLELKRKGWLDRFAANVKRIWAAGASANIELPPSDELLPYIDEIKQFSVANFGALPHLTILRDDRTSGIDYLTKLAMTEYDKVWSDFDSHFWQFKKTIFGVRQTSFCYAGGWPAYIDLTTGEASGCYGKVKLGDVLKEPGKPFPFKPIGKCPIAHCYNGHALLSMGLIPDLQTPGYGYLRDRVKENGEHWLNPELRGFFDEKLADSNVPLSRTEQLCEIAKRKLDVCKNIPSSAVRRLKSMLKYSNHAKGK